MMKKILLLLFSPFIINAQTAFISGTHNLCDNEKEVLIKISFTEATPPFTFAYAIDAINPLVIQNIFDNPYFLPASNQGIYTITAFNDAVSVGTFNGSASVTIIESPIAVIQLASDTFSTIEPHVYLISQSVGSIVSLLWDFGDGSPIESISNPDHTFPLYVFGCTNATASNYDATATIDDGSCMNCTNSLGTPQLCYSDLYVPPSACFKAEHSTLGIPALYQTALIVQDINGCSDTATKIIWISDDYWMYIPNSFTPNLDEKNRNEKFCFEYHGIRKSTFLFKVYNAQGNLVYQSTDPDKLRCSCDNGGWDGTYFRTQEKLSSGVYSYNLFFQEIEGWKHNKYGAITLIR